MRHFLGITGLIGLLILVGTRALGAGLFPIAALMVLPVLYFSWREALVFIFLLTLVWEAVLPLPFGWVAVPLTVVGLSIQLLGRHQLRTNFLGQILALLLLQSTVTIALGLAMPPRTVAGALLQTTESIVQLGLAVIISTLWIMSVNWIGKKRFNVTLERRLKDL